MAKNKFYVVWDGAEDGVFTSWEACKESVSGYPGAKYKSFSTEQEAEEAFERGYEETKKQLKDTKQAPAWCLDAIAVDAACSGNPGSMEYRGVYLRTGKEIFHSKVMFGTNNIGEFLAIVHGLALLKQKGLQDMVIYSDSVNAQLWVKKKKCKTTLERTARTEELFNIIDRAEAWLHNNTYSNPIIKWRTDEWGEIPADFGRK